MAEEKQSALERFLTRAGLGTLGGAVGGGMTMGPRGAALGALFGGTLGGGSAAIGDAVHGVPNPGESGFGGEFKRGATGGAALGGALGFLGAGAMPGGMGIIKHLMQRGISKNKAIAMVLGGAAGGGAIGGSLSAGLDQGLQLGLDDKE